VGQREALPAYRYVATLLTVAAALCVIAIGFNVVVDPFEMYGIVEMRGFNVEKPALYQRVKLAKAYAVRRVHPRSVVLGTSRSHIGLRMDHPGWAPDASPRYNLAFDGATTREMYYYLMHANAATPLRQVVLGLDTWQLHPWPPDERPGFDESVLFQPHAFLHNLTLLPDLRLLASVDTTLASVQTIRQQAPDAPHWLASDGQRLGAVFFRRAGEGFFEDGPGAYFAAVDRQEIRFKLPEPGAARRRASSPDAGTRETSRDYIRRIIGFCRDQGIDLRIYITPAHAHQLEISAAMGEWAAIEDGKRALVHMIAEDARAHPGARPFPVLDFSGYSPITTESVPPSGSRAEMAYYWDSSHFKESVGDMVLERLLSTRVANDQSAKDFGVALSTENIEEVLADIRTGHERYRREHPSDVALIRAMIAELRGEASVAVRQ